MQTSLIDTNILIDAFVRQGKKSDDSIAYLTNTKLNLYVSWLVLAEFEWVLRSAYKYNRDQITRLLKNIVCLDHIEIDNRSVFLLALNLYTTFSADFTDCLNASIAASKNCTITSYDDDFDKFSFITRLEP